MSKDTNDEKPPVPPSCTCTVRPPTGISIQFIAIGGASDSFCCERCSAAEIGVGSVPSWPCT